MYYCKTALSKSKLPGIDYSLNPYLGCEHACVYCYVPSLLRMDADKWYNARVKINIPHILMKELRRKKRGIVGISSSTDAYQPLEKKYEVTKKCLALLQKYDYPVNIQTKSELVKRDIGLFKKFHDIAIGVTITSFNEEILPKWEPMASEPEKRLNAIKKIADNGVYTYIFFGPFFPLMEKEEIKYCLESFMDAGVNEIMVDRLHLKTGVLERIEKAFPDKIKEIKRRIYGGYYEKIFKEIQRSSGVVLRRAWM